MNHRIPACFKAYDIRGQVPADLDENLAFRIGRAFARQFDAREVVIGRDARHEAPQLARALALGLEDAGARVADLGLCGTEEVYFATFHGGFDGGIMVTASHNPKGWCGMKLVRAGAQPISGDSGLTELGQAVADDRSTPPAREPSVRRLDLRADYAGHLLGYIDRDALRPLKLVVNPGNGTAGAVIDALAPQLPFSFVRVHFEPDGDFPHGVPNPLLPEMRQATAQAVRESGADMGITWDGDFDRCFLFDEHGQFIEGYYIVGLLAQMMLAREPGGRIIHDPRLYWNTEELVRQAGGVPVMSKTGHAFIKERMRAENAVYGGEMSAHHYFRDFAYCDNGNIPWLLVAEALGRTGRPLSELVAERMARYPASGEINRRVRDISATIAAIEHEYASRAEQVDHTDGLSLSFGDWRFNLRGSNTEPVLRLNVESRGDRELMERRTAELLAAIDRIQA